MRLFLFVSEYIVLSSFVASASLLDDYSYIANKPKPHHQPKASRSRIRIAVPQQPLNRAGLG